MPRRASGSIVRRGDRFYIRVTMPGGGRTTRGSWPTKKDAENAVPALMAEIHAQATDLPDVGLWTFVEDEYRGVLRVRLAETTRKIVEAMLRDCAAWVKERHAVPTMRVVDAAAAEAYVAHLAESIMVSTIARHVQVLRQAWAAAMSRGYADLNPWRGIKLRKEQERVVPWVSPADLRRLVAAIAPRHRGLALFLAETGLRRGEAYALEWRDVDFPRGVVLVRRSKSRRIREVPVPTDSLEELRALPRTADLVFASLPSHDILRQDLALAAARVGLPPLRVHDLRHVYASHLVRAGVPVPTVAGLLGHADGGKLVLMRYGRWQPQDAATLALERLAAFRAAPEPEEAPKPTRAERTA